MMRYRVIPLILIVTFLLSACQGPLAGSFTFEDQIERYKTLDTSWRFKLSTLNVYGLKLISPYKKQRMPAIGEALKKRNLDVAVLQEAWTEAGRKDIQTHSNFGVSRYFDKEGTIGSGMMFLTDIPVELIDFKTFTLDGRLLEFWQGDRLAAKGISLIQITKDQVPVDVFDMHTLARYENFLKPSDRYTPERLAQLFEAFDFIVNRRTSPIFVLGTDMNSDIPTEEFQFWLRLTGLETSALSGPESCTYCPPNSFVKGDQGQLDHVSISPLLQFDEIHRDYEEVIKIDSHKTSNLSDHFGLTAVVRGNTKQFKNPPSHIFETIHYLKWRLEDYLTWYSPLSEPDEPGKLDIKKQIEFVLHRVNFYIQAIERGGDDSDDAKSLRRNYQAYLDLFK